jgi:hypothetical protein
LYCSDPQPSFVYRRVAELTNQEPMPGRDHPMIGSALDAAGYLYRYREQNESEKLGLSNEYDLVADKNQYNLGNIQRDNVRKLYGDRLDLSASKVDTFAGCRLQFFLKYGMRLKKRMEATIDPIQYGTFVHAVLEYTVRDVMAAGGFTDTAGDFLLDVVFPDALLMQLPESKQEAAKAVLSHDPRPSYQRKPGRIYGLDFAGFNIRFTVEENTLMVVSIEPINA